MFGTFTGSSRRPRNVNLSGQRNQSPWAATSWTPGASSNASRTVAEAQAERRHRQQERDKLKAAQSIQRAWRGHKARRTLRDARRQSFDRLYDTDISVSVSDARQRSVEALPLLLAFFNATHPEDRPRLERFDQDLLQTKCFLIHSEKTYDSQLRRLARHLIAALQAPCTNETLQDLLRPLIEIVATRYRVVEGSLDALYESIGRHCRKGAPRDESSLALLEKAILIPMELDAGRRASAAFAFSFLTQHDLDLFEENIGSFAEHIDVEKISVAIQEGHSQGWAIGSSTDDRLWLLAHFIALEKGRGIAGHSPSYLDALYTQLSNLQPELRDRHIGKTSFPLKASRDPENCLSPFIDKAIESLVDKDEVSNVLEKFTTNYASSSQEEFEEASLLAAYVLTLIRCFPDLSDELRMRLYLADVPAPSGRLVSVKFFWGAMTRTHVFSRIVSDEQASLDVLRKDRRRQDRLFKDTALWDREWRTIFLFLELYIFVLRLTDDEDFFAPFSSSRLQSKAPSRLRSSMLALSDLKSLSLFLRNLAFTLYYNAEDLAQHESAVAANATTLGEVFGAGSRKIDIQSAEKAERQQALSFNVIPGVDFTAFRGMITTAMRMVYERDSRQKFLPPDHWLMTERVGSDMESFLSAVVLENQQQQHLGQDESDEEDVDMDDFTGSVGDMGNFYSAQGLRMSRNAQMEKRQAQQRRMQRQRLLAAVGPKLEILRSMPFVIPFDVRVKIFRQFVYLDKERRRDGDIDPENWRMRIISANMNDHTRGRSIISQHSARIRRGKLFEDAFSQFFELGDGLKEPIQITFVDKFNTPEAGIDGGGVTKEFLTSVTKEAFADELSLFISNSKNSLYPNPSALDQRQERLRQAGLTPEEAEWKESMSELLQQYEFLGRIIGKCMYEGILIDVAFAGFFLLKWAASASDAGYRASINDLKELDEELYQGMISLKNYSGNVADLSIDFTIEDQVSMPGEPVRTTTRNLMPNGDQILVTNENRPLYISYVARHRLVAQPFSVTRAFLRGLGSIIEPSWLSMFNQSELQRLVGGDSSEIDVEDLRRNTICSGLYQVGDDGQEHPVIRMFWEVMRSLKDSDRRAVLKYVTSTPRAPLLGFSQLSPRFSIRDGGNDQTRLPSASTCVNLLKLPLYPSAQVLRSKLLYAVTSNAGFDLS